MVQGHLFKRVSHTHFESQPLMPHTVNVILSISPPVMTLPCGQKKYSALLMSCGEHLARELSDLTACWPLCVSDGSFASMFLWQCHCRSACRYLH